MTITLTDIYLFDRSISPSASPCRFLSRPVVYSFCFVLRQGRDRTFRTFRITRVTRGAGPGRAGARSLGAASVRPSATRFTAVGLFASERKRYRKRSAESTASRGLLRSSHAGAMQTSDQDLRAALSDTRAALEASERRTTRARDETRVARRERDDAAASAQRLREALKTFAAGGGDEEEEEEEDEEDDDGPKAQDLTEAHARKSETPSTTQHESIESHTESSSVEVSVLTAKLAAALAALTAARATNETLQDKITEIETRHDAAFDRSLATARASKLLTAKLETAQVATTVARTQLAETTEMLRRRFANEGSRGSPERTKKEGGSNVNEGTRNNVNDDEAQIGNARTLSVIAQMETTVTRLASVLRGREIDLARMKQTVAVLVTERGTMEGTVQTLRDELKMMIEKTGFEKRKENRSRNGDGNSTPAPTALSRAARGSVSRRGGRALLEREGLVPRQRAFTSTKK